MMPTTLDTPELVRLIRTVFAPRADERALAVLADLPDKRLPDRPSWAARRRIATDWAARLAGAATEAGVAGARLVLYRNVGRNNADLPPTAWLDGDRASEPVPFDEVLSSHSIVLAMTELSATAPLKIAARRLGFRAATMGGFSPSMVPALRLDYDEIDRRCRAIKERLDPADEARIRFECEGRQLELVVDLRGQRATVSSGLLREPGIAGNLPSGETYVVPYEGGREEGTSRTRGQLPVELGHELVVYTIEGNRALEVEGAGPVAAREREELRAEPAYGNIAELGFGVLHALGIRPIGELLLDEKLGFHLAFGRSDHFGGCVGPSEFRSPSHVVHIDRVYLPELQPRVHVRSLDLVVEGSARPLLHDGAYVDVPW